MDIDNEIRKQVMKGNSGEIRDLLLNSSQIEILKEIGNKEITSCQLSTQINVSIQNANGKLERLRQSGYLRRSNIGDPTGGDMYVYECAPVALNNWQ